MGNTISFDFEVDLKQVISKFYPSMVNLPYNSVVKRMYAKEVLWA